MRAVLYSKFQEELSVVEVPDPRPKDHGVVLQVTATGLCRSDWHGWMGHDPDIALPHVPGHELAGTIVGKGKKVKDFDLGDRVTVPFVCGCGNCSECMSGNHQVCDHQSQPGFTHWGSFAEYVSIDHADVNLVRLPDDITDITAATLGCRFITSFRAVVVHGRVSQATSIAIHGCGGVGLSAIMIAHALGAKIIAIDINPENLALAQQFGAHHTINASDGNVVGAVKEFSKGGVEVSIDALGSQETCFNSIANLKKRGRHVQVGLVAGDELHPKIPMELVIANELEIVGSHGMQAHRYPEMLNMIQNGQLQPQRLIQKTISLDEVCDLLPKMNDFGHKGMMVIDRF